MQIEKNSMILAENQYYSLDTKKTQLNNNVLVVGTSGAGKTRSIVTPNLLQACGSYIVSDPKGNLFKKYGKFLKEKGYVVKCLDFVHPERSIGYNPLSYINSTQDIIKMASMLIYQRKQASYPDPFWDESGTILLSSLIAYVKESDHSEVMENFHSILKLLCAGRRGTNCDGKTVLEMLMEELHFSYPDSWAYDQFEKANVAADRTFDSILITLTSKLRNFDTKELNRMLQKDEINIRSIGRRKTALFVVVSDTDRSMDNIANLFFTQAMNELCLYADEDCRDNMLPVPVRFILDDFATNCSIEEFPRMIASIRSRGISTMLMVQSEAQLTEGYGFDGRTIIGNCDTYVYLGGNDVETAKAVAERCDVPVQRILNMPVGHNWLFRRGQVPSYNRNFDTALLLKEHEKTKYKQEAYCLRLRRS